jgi:Lrp/AsnC family transcriptional regulator for asnA, asnC and gidA
MAARVKERSAQTNRARTWKLDRLDQAIIRLLQEGADRTNASIAEEVGSTESTVRRRRDALIRRGVIRITAVVDPLQIGYQIMALIGLQVDGRKLNEAAAALASMAELRFVGLTLGRYDILTEAWFLSTEQLLDFVTERLNKVPGVLRSETLQIAKLVKYGYDWGQST